MGSPLCPADSTVNFSGLMGTNLFVTPKQDYTKDDETFQKYKNNYVQFAFASHSFDMHKFLDVSADIKNPFDPAYELYSKILDVEFDTTNPIDKMASI